MNVANRLIESIQRQLRERVGEVGLTHAEIARRIGCTRENVTLALGSQTSPKLDRLERIASAIGFEIDVELRPAREKISA